MCQYTHVPAHLPHVKLTNLACACTATWNFGMHMIANEHTQHTSDALGLPHYTYGVLVQHMYIYTDNEIHRFCSWAASNNILPLTKYMGVSLLINM